MPPLSTTTTPPAKAVAASASKRPPPSQSTSTADHSLLSASKGLKRKPSAGILTTSTTAGGTRTAHITTTADVVQPTVATSTTPHASRNPLRLREQNAPATLHVVKPRSSAPKPLNLTAARMPSYERSGPAAPRQSTVARAANNKPPVTPKLAPRTAASSQHVPALASPLQRRSAEASTLGVHGGRDELMSPVSAFLSSNVTPRSNSRQSRVDSANSTPTGTPLPERSDPWETRSGVGASGPDDSRRPVVTLSPASEVGGPSRQDRDSKFFYASEAQKPASQPASSRPSSLQQAKSASFFYANGNMVPDRHHAAPRPFSPPMASPSPASQESKFVYANGTPELQPAAKIGPTPKSSASVISKAPNRQGNTPRSTSPTKLTFGTAKSSSSATVSPRSSISVANPQGRTNVEYPTRPRTHSRTKSATAVDLPMATRRLSGQASPLASGNTSPSNPPRHGPILANSQAAAGFASLLQAAEDFAAEADDAHSDSHSEAHPEAHHESTTKTPQDNPEADLVANARRERKVQDLEITNASLAAINRTLERQLRKQTAELRRYQRLSRAGRLSINSVGSSSQRIPSDSTVDGGGLARASINLNDLSEEDGEIEAENSEMDPDLDDDHDHDDDDDDGDLSGSEASVSGDVTTAGAAPEGGDANPASTSELRQEKRRRDEKRLQVDLSKHQQLLRDSQRMNQSLKRCLGWTEELIKEGKRALSYQVRVSDVSLGGRVLAPEEVERRQRAAEGDETEDTGLEEDETIYAIDALGRDALVEDGDGDGEGDATDADTDAASIPPATWGKDAQDRDSGIELATDGC
ncbi:hypothetical protein VTJ49DRAFT_4215 [Mycothermus thermophilus]|uniref:Uncharacterized protein n=1 Tax=Humicola insolens TaxID=85995 RepID=A0ABR3V5X3_HUMIN